MLTDTLAFAGSLADVGAVIALGLFAGAMLTEGCVLVPYWQSIDAAAFHAWYRANAARLVRYFGPLTWLAGLSTLGSALVRFTLGAPSLTWSLASAALMLMVVAMFPLYFKDSNGRFLAGMESATHTATALRSWAAWHWLRTALSCAALIAATQAL